MFTVDPAASTPVYEQLVECVLRDVSSGELMVGDRIPPVRALASELGLSAGTVAKAYRAMETRGVIETHGRKGTFIAQGRDDRDAAAARAAARYLDEVAGQLHRAPAGPSEVNRTVHPGPVTSTACATSCADNSAPARSLRARRSSPRLANATHPSSSTRRSSRTTSVRTSVTRSPRPATR